MEAALPDELAYFPLSKVFSLSLSPPLSSDSEFLISLTWPLKALLGRYGEEESRTRLAVAPWVVAVLILFGEQCPAFAHNLLPGRGCPSYASHRRTTSMTSVPSCVWFKKLIFVTS